MELLRYGLLAASINALMFYVWLAFWAIAGGTPLILRLRDACDHVGLGLTIWALIGAIFGRGEARGPVAIGALLGFMLWVPVVIF